MISLDLAKQFVSYNPETGRLIWNVTKPEMFCDGKRTAEQKCRMFNARFANKEAFTAINGHGYKAGSICNNRITAHRLIWFLVHGEMPDNIDHINGNKLDNRIKNLRNVTKSINGKNLGISTRNKSGYIGVRFNQSRNRWEADIRVGGHLKFLGRYKELSDALLARRAAEKAYGFHQNHGRRHS